MWWYDDANDDANTDHTLDNMENLNIEGQLLYKVNYDKGMELILAAAKEFMDSSTLLNDETMVLAK